MHKRITIVLFFVSLIGFAQVELRGVVNDLNNQFPVLGATVLVKDSNNGTATDFDGEFNIKVNSLPVTLIISYVGYLSQEILVTDASEITVSLKEDIAQLEEVVIVGYSTQQRQKVTGAIGEIDSDVIEKFKPQRIEQAVQGQLAGVTALPASGAPGSSFAFNIRGIGTNGNNRPLILVDGIITEDGLTSINPNDIKSITVLKDVEAAIYGTRGANGVVIVTTKTGRKNQKTKFTINSSSGFQELQRRIPVLNATEYALYQNEAAINDGLPPIYTNIEQIGQGTDWQDEVFNTATVHNFDLTASGGTETSTFSFSLGYITQDGILGGDKSGFDRFNAKIAFTQELSDKIKFTGKQFYSNIKQSTVADSGLGSITFNAINNSPLFDVFDNDGNFTFAPGLGAEIINPVHQLANTFNESVTSKFFGSYKLEYKLSPSLTLENSLGYNFAFTKGTGFTPEAFYGDGKVFNTVQSSVFEFKDDFFDYTYDALLKYKNTFSEHHNVSGLLGYSYFRNTGDFFNGTAFDVLNNDPNNANISLATGPLEQQSVGDGQFKTTLQSVFARANYDYKNKYLISATIRRDQSSNFGPNNAVAYFPSGSLGYVVSNEEFFEDVKTIDFLKFRLSYGVLGNDRIIPNAYLSSLTGEAEYTFDDVLVTGQATGIIANPNIKWEETDLFNAGVDVKLFDNALSLTGEYYIKTTRDLLLQANVSGLLGVEAPGASNPVVNAGTVRNTGVEIQANFNKDLGEHWRIGISGNASFLNNEVLEVANGRGFQEGGSFSVGIPGGISRMTEGDPLGYFFGFKTDGIFQNQAEVDQHAEQALARPGELRFVDQNDDGIINAADRTNIGDPIADFSFGFNFNIAYKGFDLAVTTFGQTQFDIVRNYNRLVPNANKTVRELDRWTGEGTSNSGPRATLGNSTRYSFSDYYIEDGSFWRIQNVQVGYELPAKFYEQLGISRLRIYAQVDNLFTFTEYSGYDPTIRGGDRFTGGFSPLASYIDTGFFPTPRTYTMGINLSF